MGRRYLFRLKAEATNRSPRRVGGNSRPGVDSRVTLVWKRQIALPT
jgi:hypothetical protein